MQESTSSNNILQHAAKFILVNEDPTLQKKIKSSIQVKFFLMSN